VKQTHHSDARQFCRFNCTIERDTFGLYQGCSTILDGRHRLPGPPLCQSIFHLLLYIRANMPSAWGSFGSQFIGGNTSAPTAAAPRPKEKKRVYNADFSFLCLSAACRGGAGIAAMNWDQSFAQALGNVGSNIEAAGERCF